VGGGATGCGTALDACTRGLSTALIERSDFASETSARSTKLIWAGIRYIGTSLAQLLRFRNFTRPLAAIDDFIGEFNMVLGCHKERKLIMENNPHLTNWVPIAVPMRTWISWPPPLGHPLFALAPFTMPAVLKFYDSLSGFSCPPSHVMGKARARRKFPQLDQDFKYVSVFYEGQHNDARTATCIALAAAEEGATITNHTEMVGIVREGDLNDESTTLKKGEGKAVGAIVRDKISGKEFVVRARSIIFAGGPFTDGMRKMEDPKSKAAVNGAAGTHIILPGYYSPDGFGLLDVNTSDGRFLFFLPWEGNTLVGTTDRKGTPTSSPGPPEDDVQYLLKECEKYISPDLKIRRSDVLSSWQGWRPLASDPNAPPGAPASRDHVISVNPDTGITFITGGKWTTYREMAEDVVNRVIRDRGWEDRVENGEKINGDKDGEDIVVGPCVTTTRSLHGGEGYTRHVPVQLVQHYGVSMDTAKHLARTYGTHAFDVCENAKPTGKAQPRFGVPIVDGFPYLECEIDWMVDREMAVTVTDVLTTRTRLAYLNVDAARVAAPKVANIMAKRLRWGWAEKRRQLSDAIQCLDEFGGPIPANLGAEFRSDGDTVRQQIFDIIDRDGNGYIDFVEMWEVLKHLEVGLPEWEARATFDRIDTSKKGKITKEEFLNWWEEVGPDDNLRKKLSEKVMFSLDKLGEGSGSRGVMFG